MQRDERDERLPDILAQDTEFPQYFLHLLGMTEATHPETFLVLKIAARVGENAMVYFKDRYRRERPSQIIPALFPPVEFSHPSYPSGHALVSHLMARCAATVRPEMKDALTELANEIAYNREAAGLHTRSDTKAGAELADKLFDRLSGLERVKQAFEAAKEEWKAGDQAQKKIA